MPESAEMPAKRDPSAPPPRRTRDADGSALLTTNARRIVAFLSSQNHANMPSEKQTELRLWTLK
jgi:hypothetical protein